MKKATNWLAFGLLFVTMGTFWAQEEKKKPESTPPPGSQTTTTPVAQGPHSYNFKPEDSARKNPIRFTDFSVDKGKKLFATQCAMCHGKNADGKGDPDFLAEIKATPPDLTKEETLKKRTDGELFFIITSGSEIMPSEGDRMKDRQKWDLVNYLRSLGGKSPLRATDEERLVDTTIVK